MCVCVCARAYLYVSGVCMFACVPMRGCVCVPAFLACVRAYVCVRACGVLVCVCARARVCACVCVCLSERERERDV